MAEIDGRNTDASPPIESLIEIIPEPQRTLTPCHTLAMHVKRIKREHERAHTPLKNVEGEVFEDDCLAFGRLVTAQLRQMTQSQKLLAVRLMSEVSFRGQMQTLQMNTVLTTATSFQQFQPYPTRPSPANFGRGGDILMVHHPGIRSHASVPLNLNHVNGTSQPFQQNFLNGQQQQQQSEHVPGMNPLVNIKSSDNNQ